MYKILITFLIISCYLAILINCTRPVECELPHKTGPCRAMFPSYYFNPSLDKCEQFTYGGCDGNENRFETEEQCLKRCGSSSGRNG